MLNHKLRSRELSLHKYELLAPNLMIIVKVLRLR